MSILEKLLMKHWDRIMRKKLKHMCFVSNINSFSNENLTRNLLLENVTCNSESIKIYY